MLKYDSTTSKVLYTCFISMLPVFLIWSEMKQIPFIHGPMDLFSFQGVGKTE